MKKLAPLALVGLALTAFAAPQKLLEVTVTDRNEIIQQATALGQLVEVPMIGLAAVGGLAANPAATEFGAMRDGAVTTFLIEADPDVIGTTPESCTAFCETAHYAAIYPTSKTKADYLSRHEGAKEEDGVIVTDGLTCAFSADGQWVVVADTAEMARRSLAAVGQAKLTQGEAVRLTVTEPGMATVKKFVSLAEKMMAEAGSCESIDPAAFKAAVALIGQVRSLSLSLRADEKGFDALCSITPVAGTEVARIGEKRLTASDPLAFAGTGALVAAAVAADCGQQHGIDQREALFAVLKKFGFSFKFLSIEKNDATCRVTLDVPALIEYVKTEGLAIFKRIESDEAAQKELVAQMQTMQTKPFTADGAEGAVAYGIKGVALKTTASERFAKAMPDLKGKPLSAVEVVSFYATLRLLVEQVLANVPAFDEAEMVREALKSLPAAGDGCFAAAFWKEAGDLKTILRITPTEMQALSALVRKVIELGSAGVCSDDDLEEDSDDDDDTDN